MSTVLVLNAGSSSIRYELVDPDTGARPMAGTVERIGEGSPATITHEVDGRPTLRSSVLADHAAALAAVLDLCREVGPDLGAAGIVAVGHRVVMGADRYAGPVLIDDAVVADIEALAPLAPLHNPPNLQGIAVARALLPDVPHVAAFDTAWFRDLPSAAATYAIDRAVAREHGIRRYGAHGTSHQYVAGRAADLLERDPAELRMVVLHLGNGASASAVAGGRPVDTSMGFTPLEGLVMGTRSGDLDPAVVLFLSRAGMALDEVDELLHRQSGLRGLAGHNDLREIHRLIAAGNDDARLALDVYVHRIRKYVGAYAAVLGGLDALVFTAGVGENDPVVRSEVCAPLGYLGIRLDPEANAHPPAGGGPISADGSSTTALVVPTDEELAIARQAFITAVADT